MLPSIFGSSSATVDEETPVAPADSGTSLLSDSVRNWWSGGDEDEVLFLSLCQ